MHQKASKITKMRVRVQWKGLGRGFRAVFIWTDSHEATTASDSLVGPRGCRLEPKATDKGHWSAILKS